MRERVMIFDPETGSMKPAWSDRGPGYARAAGTRGELVVGVSQRTQDKLNDRRREKDAA